MEKLKGYTASNGLHVAARNGKDCLSEIRNWERAVERFEVTDAGMHPLLKSIQDPEGKTFLDRQDYVKKAVAAFREMQKAFGWRTANDYL